MNRNTRQMLLHTTNAIFPLQVNCPQFTFTYTSIIMEVWTVTAEDISLLKQGRSLQLFRQTSQLCLLLFVVLSHLASISHDHSHNEPSGLSFTSTQKSTAGFRKWTRFDVWNIPASLSVFSYYTTETQWCYCLSAPCI